MAKRRKASVDTAPADLSGFMLELYLLQKYGPRLTIQQVADVLQISRTTAFRRMGEKDFPVPTYIDGGLRFADFRDVAKHLTHCREEAQERAEQE